MAENQKYNLKDGLLEADERLTGSLSLLGMSMLTQPAYINSMRSVMFTSHLKQFVNLTNPEFPAMFTNGENVVGKYSNSYKKTKRDVVVYKKIVKFKDIVDKPYEYKLFTYDPKEMKYDVITRKGTENLTEVFGYDYNNEVIDSLNEGDDIPKGTVLYRSTSYDENMNYGYGKNVKIMYTLDPFTSEDAAVVSRRLADEMQSIEVNTVTIGINDNDFLLNLYGKDGKYKPLPDIGECAGGIIAAIRTLFTDQLLADFKDNSLNRISESDRKFYLDGEVIDVEVYCNNEELDKSSPFNAQIVKYLDAQTEYYQEIYDTCKEIKKSGCKYTHNVDYLYKRAKEFLNTDLKWKDGDSQFSNIVVNLTTRKVVPLQIGQKITGRYGNKSVIAQIRENDEMSYYYDENGERQQIDLYLNVLAIINRTTAMALYEITINFICNKVRMQMSHMSSLKEKEKLLFDIIKEFNENQYKKMKSIYDGLSTSEKKAYIQSCIDERIFIHQAPLWETKPIFFRIFDIYEKYDFLKPYDMYINKWGREIKLLNKSYIGDMYIMKLKQTSRKGFSVRSTGSINNRGLPSKSYKNKSHMESHSTKPIRFGEFETLNFTIGTMPEEMALFHMIYRTSVKGRRDLAEQILNPDECEIDASYTSRVSEILSVILKSLGLSLDFVDDENVVKELDDSKIQYFKDEEDGEDYLCTELQYFLIQRRKEVRKEILHQYGIIDNDELERLVDAELDRRQYIMGDPNKNSVVFNDLEEINTL